ncbi:MAG: acyl-CoA dehydratase activase-related protein [bacterium]
MQTVGICRALDAYRFLPAWESFIAGLGFEVRVSPPTSRRMLLAGIRIAPAELCLPVKAFLGHVVTLAPSVDRLLLPRLVCWRRDGDIEFACPKALALPDLTRALLPDLPPAAEIVFDERAHSEDESFRRLARALGVGGGRWRRALRAARSVVSAGVGVDAANASGPRVAVVGHDYLLGDDELSMGVVAALRRAGASPFVARPGVADSVPPGCFEPNWRFERELLRAAFRAAADPEVGGLVLAASFACGTAAVTNELIRLSVRRVPGREAGMPILELLFDEHSSPGGLATRLESFVEMLRRPRASRRLDSAAVGR